MMADWRRWDRAFASDLVRVEVRRALHRVHAERNMSDEDIARNWSNLVTIEVTMTWLPLDEAVLEFASGRTREPLKTLDALHLATARLVRDDVPDLVFATHDRRLATAAETSGFPVDGV